MYSVNILNSTLGNINVTGQSQQTAGVILLPISKNTITIVLSNFIGRIYIEGSSSQTTPTEWFPIQIGANLAYVQYPFNTTSMVSTSGQFTYNFNGAFLWVRARIDRTYLTPQPTDPYVLGFVQQVWMNYSLTASNCSTAGNTCCNCNFNPCRCNWFSMSNQWNNNYTNDPYGDPCYCPEGPQRNINGPWYNPEGPNHKPGYIYGPWQGPNEGFYGPNCEPSCPSEYSFGQDQAHGPYVGALQGYGPYNGPVTYRGPIHNKYAYINSYGNYNGDVGYYDPAYSGNCS